MGAEAMPRTRGGRANGKVVVIVQCTDVGSLNGRHCDRSSGSGREFDLECAIVYHDHGADIACAQAELRQVPAKRDNIEFADLTHGEVPPGTQ